MNNRPMPDRPVQELCKRINGVTQFARFQINVREQAAKQRRADAAGEHQQGLPLFRADEENRRQRARCQM